jgi:hypothetical protein
MTSETELPMFEEIKQHMNFDPDAQVLVPFIKDHWYLDEQYPPSVGELIAHLETEEKHG